jgi:hypothetical protein
MADTPIDLNSLPTGIDVGSIVDSAVAANSSALPLDTTSGAQNISSQFCLQFNGRPWTTITVAAPSPELALLTVNQIVQRVNEVLVQAGYPPNLCTAALGSC